MKKSKRYLDIKSKIEDKEYSLNDSLNLIKDISSAKFDESVEIHLLTNADPKNADQQLRTVADLPHGTGKQVRVLVFAEGDAAVSAKEAGADYISDEEIVDRCILGLVNEGAKILEEGVAQRSSDMDIVYILSLIHI